MGTEGARALVERAAALTLQTGNLLNWGCLRKKCPATPAEEVSGARRPAELPLGAPRRALASEAGGRAAAGACAAGGRGGRAARLPSGRCGSRRSGGLPRRRRERGRPGNREVTRRRACSSGAAQPGLVPVRHRGEKGLIALTTASAAPALRARRTAREVRAGNGKTGCRRLRLFRVFWPAGKSVGPVPVRGAAPRGWPGRRQPPAWRRGAWGGKPAGWPCWGAPGRRPGQPALATAHRSPRAPGGALLCPSPFRKEPDRVSALGG